MNTVIQLVDKTKICVKCNTAKSLSEFSRHNASSDGLRPRCKTCINEGYKSRREGLPDLRKNVTLTENGRKCNECGESKSWSDFSKDRTGYNGLTSTCKPCRNAKSRQAFKDNPRVRRQGLKNRPDKVLRLYGVTYEHVVQTLSNQHCLCANRACGKTISLDVTGNAPDRAVIDHDHKTGKFRALLCSACNLVLGHLENRENIVLGLMEYTIKYKTD